MQIWICWKFNSLTLVGHAVLNYWNVVVKTALYILFVNMPKKIIDNSL